MRPIPRKAQDFGVLAADLASVFRLAGLHARDVEITVERDGTYDGLRVIATMPGRDPFVVLAPISPTRQEADEVLDETCSKVLAWVNEAKDPHEVAFLPEGVE